MIARLLADPPVGIGSDAARDAAVRELAKPEYEHENWFDRFQERFWLWLDDLLDSATGVPGGPLTLVIFVLLVCAIGALLWRVGRRATRSRGAERESLFGERALSAAEHRAAADRHAAALEWAAAIRERLRAIARDLEERTIVEPLPGRTADELAAEAGAALPTLGRELAIAARSFDDVTYGGHEGSPEAYDAMVALDGAVKATRPELRTAP